MAARRTGKRFGEHHAFLLGVHLGHIDHLSEAIGALDAEVEKVIAPFGEQLDRLCTIPGVAKRTAEVVIAEIGVDISRFPTSGHLASWAGMCPGNNESAGKRRSGRARKGDQALYTRVVRYRPLTCTYAARPGGLEPPAF